jgi:hypothetical protein
MTYKNAIQILFDRLDDLHLTEQVPDRLYQKKKGVRSLVRAVNKADQTISALRKMPQAVALYIPAGTTVVPLLTYGQYQAEATQPVIDNPLFDQNPAAGSFFLHQQPWLHIASVLSTEIQVYTDHPTQAKHTGVLHRTDHHNFHSLPIHPETDLEAKPPGRFHYDLATRTIRVSKAYDQAVFLVFEALIIPADINLRDIKDGDINSVETKQTITINGCATDWRGITTHTPNQQERVLIDVALTELLPGVLPAIPVPEIEIMLRGLDSGNGPVTHIPEGTYPTFGYE